VSVTDGGSAVDFVADLLRAGLCRPLWQMYARMVPPLAVRACARLLSAAAPADAGRPSHQTSVSASAAGMPSARGST
jgi:hypothetical protein